MKLELKELPAFEVAYVRHVGSYAHTCVAWDQLAPWAWKHELVPPAQSMIGISLDNPQVVEESALRYDACVTIPVGFDKEAHSDVQFRTLEGGLYAVYSFYDTVDKFGLLFQHVYGESLPASEYEADDRAPLEFCMNNPAEDPEGKCKIDLHIPVKKRNS
jgi:AraC family transcriptional regulator